MDMKSLIRSTALISIFLGSVLLGRCGACGGKPPKPKVVKDALTAALAIEYLEEQKNNIDEEIEEIEEEIFDEYEDMSTRACFDICANAVERESEQARRCCRQLRHRLHEVRESIEEQISATDVCCSTVDSVESLVDVQTSQIDACCSSIVETLGTLDETCLDIPASLIDSSALPALQWLKSIYCLLFEIGECLGCLG